MESTKEYIKLFNACPIKIGGTVRVLRGWKDGEYGYVCGRDYDVDTPRLGVDYLVKDKHDEYYEIYISIIGDKKDIWYVPFFVLEVVKSAPVNTVTFKDYLAFHESSGLKVGDKVKITRKSDDYEMGWDNAWVDKMDSCVGNVGEIIGDECSSGWLVNVCGINRDYPTFVLQKIDEPTEKEEMKPVLEEIVVKENSVVVNGYELTKEQVGALHYKLFRKGKKQVKKTCEVKHKAHNPDNLTPEQYGKSEGYRLLDEDEVIIRERSYKEIERWNHKLSVWEAKWRGEYFGLTYRTKLSRKQLAKLK